MADTGTASWVKATSIAVTAGGERETSGGTVRSP